jgi:hypothetical protein
LRRLSKDDVKQISDQVMQILLYMLTSADQSSVQEDTLLAINALVNGTHSFESRWLLVYL